MKGEILATYSPCCGMVRTGPQPPAVMHSGLCREKHNGVLGPTIYLTEAYRVPREPPHCPTCDCGSTEHPTGNP